MNGGCALITLISTKQCPKDHFGLPRINQVIDSMAGCVLLSFLDCYSGYHQIALKEEDQIKIALEQDHKDVTKGGNTVPGRAKLPEYWP